MNATSIGALVVAGTAVGGALAPVGVGAQTPSAPTTQPATQRTGTPDCVTHWAGTTNCMTTNELFFLSLLAGLFDPGAGRSTATFAL